MARRTAYKRIEDLVLMLLLTTVLGSCLPPGKHLTFIADQSARDELEIRIADDKVKLEISSFSSVGWYCERYRLTLHIGVELKEKGYTMSIVPDGIAVFVGDSVMQISHSYPKHNLVKASDRKYRVDASFEFVHDLRELRVGDALPVRIVLNDFLFLDGAAVPIDTVRAQERQWREGC